MPVRRALIQMALLLALATPAAAQPPGANRAAASSSNPSRLGAGVSFLTDGEETGTGFVLDVSKTLQTTGGLSLGAVGDFGWHHFDGFSSMSFLGGARVAPALRRRYAPFGQFLIGALRLRTSFCEGDGCSESDLVFAPGGGVDIRITDRVNLRAQIDILFIRFAESTEDATRLTFGVSMPIGK